jgi:molybdate transport system substrate-binding protein
MNAVGGSIVPGSRIDLLSNQLAVAVPDDRPRQLTGVRDLLDPVFRRIALGDPAAVPAGVYARQYLTSQGLWRSLASRIVPAGSVRLALAAVESGAVDAAIVYRTDVATAAHARTAFVVPANEGPRIVYPAALVRQGLHTADGRQFLEFLRGAEASAIFSRAAFLVLSPQVDPPERQQPRVR